MDRGDYKLKIGSDVANSASTPVNLTDIANKGYVDLKALGASGHHENKYGTVAEMLADQASQTEGALQFVEDASGWSTVDSGWAEFEKLSTSTGVEADYRKDSEEESMDQVDGGGSVDAEKIYDVRTYGAKGDGIQLLDGNITSGTTAFSSATSAFSADDIGKVIHIKGAGVSGGFLTTTISGFTDANNITLTDSASTTVSATTFVYGTDDTSAIQSAIQAAYDNQGGTVYLENAIYIINGALQNAVGADAINYNSQLYIPYYEKTDEHHTSVLIKGESIPFMPQGTGIGTIERPVLKGTVLLSTIQGSGADPSVVCNTGKDSGGYSVEHGRTQAFFENLNVLVTPNENNKVTIGGINCFKSNVSGFKRVTVFPYDLNLNNSAIPDLIDVSGISMSRLNTTKTSYIEGCNVGGFTNGYKVGEHGYLNNSAANCCVNALLQTENFHNFRIFKSNLDWSVHAITIEGTGSANNGEATINADDVMVEWRQSGSWYDSVSVVNDPNNKGNGTVNYNIVVADVGKDNTVFEKIGAKNIKCTPLSLDKPFNAITGTAHTFNILDAHRLVYSLSTSATTFTIPNDSNVNFDIGAEINISQRGDGELSIAAASGVVLETTESFKMRKKYSIATLKKFDTNAWILTGDTQLL